MEKKPTDDTRLDAPDGFVGTKEASQILGVSISTVQKMADAGMLRIWRTGGGHRRIAVDSIQAAASGMGNLETLPGHLRPMAPAGIPRKRPGGMIRVLIVEDNLVAARAMIKVLNSRSARLEILEARDAASALLKCAEFDPDLVITDLVMEPFDGFHLIRVLRSSERLADTAVLVVTGLSDDEIRARGGLGEDVLVYRKPLANERLAGFIDAFVRFHR